MSPSGSILALLKLGHHKLSKGSTGEVIALVAAHPRRAGQLVECLWDDEPGVVNRAAEAVEMLSRDHPAIFSSWREPLVGLLAEAKQNKLRWMLAVTLPRLNLCRSERRRVVLALESWLDDPTEVSSIVRTCALQGLADLAAKDLSLRPAVVDLLRQHGRSGTPAMRARSRILLKKIEGTPVDELPEPHQEM